MPKDKLMMMVMMMSSVLVFAGTWRCRKVQSKHRGDAWQKDLHLVEDLVEIYQSGFYSCECFCCYSRSKHLWPKFITHVSPSLPGADPANWL